MSGLADLFSKATFGQTIQRYAEQAGWRLSDITDRRAILEFTMESGRQQTLFIIRYDSTLEFSVPTLAAFDDDDEIPAFLAVALLKRSSQKKIGFWCIEEIGGKQVCSCMHNAELQLIDARYFESVVRRLIHEAEEFDGFLAKMAEA